MKPTLKTLKITAALAAAILTAAPLAASAAPVQAASYRQADRDNGRNVHRMTPVSFNDQRHMPPPRVEHRPPMPHFGYAWHKGHWSFARGHWVWVAGVWMR